MSLPTPAEVAATDWISAIAAVLACLASVILAIIARRQSRISEKQTKILSDHAEIFSRQAYYQGQQTTISLQQAEIMEKQTGIASQQRDILAYQELERRRDKLQARFEAQIIQQKMGDRIFRHLQIRNEGPADARDVGMSLIDMSAELPVKLSHEVPQTMSFIPSGSSLNFRLFPAITDPPFYYLKISWTDGLDEKNQAKIPFTLY
jgi:hypothetical protein